MIHIASSIMITIKNKLKNKKEEKIINEEEECIINGKRCSHRGTYNSINNYCHKYNEYIFYNKKCKKCKKELDIK